MSGREWAGPLFDRPVPEARLKAADGAVVHADRAIDPEWRDRATRLLREYSHARGATPWLAEGFVAYAKATGLPDPPDARAFGGIVAAEARRGTIRRVGYRTDAFGSPKAEWVSAAS